MIATYKSFVLKNLKQYRALKWNSSGSIIKSNVEKLVAKKKSWITEKSKNIQDPGGPRLCDNPESHYQVCSDLLNGAIFTANDRLFDLNKLGQEQIRAPWPPPAG